MPVVIGFLTDVQFGSACVISANWNASPNSQRLYCLNGTSSPYKRIDKPTKTVSLTLYSPGPTVDVAPSEGCSTLNDVADNNVVIDPASCGSGGSTIAGVNEKMMVTSYSYSKEDISLPGQESWSLMTYTIGTSPDAKLPSHVIRGIAEGTATDETVCGITFSDITFSDAQAGNVSAGGLGRADSLSGGQVSQVGGGEGTGSNTGQGSVSVPYTPLWLE